MTPPVDVVMFLRVSCFMLLRVTVLREVVKVDPVYKL